ncbi:MAG TPA: type 4a pilus biogenesis protein PilO [Candidatus Margulisiibacteriota bacterium]|nr:type 4a pilus biogenesis protein PilO [Candidatus Margulisiibacteriota bacterium]
MDSTALVNKHKNKVINIFVIIIALIISSNIYQRQNSAISSMRNKKEYEAKKNKEIENINKLEKKISLYKNSLIRKDPGLIMASINSYAGEAEVNIVSIKPDSEQSHQNYSKLPFDLVISAKSYHAVGKFISKLESSEDFFIIESVSLKIESSGKQLTANIRISNLYFTN